jgi:hypothetical protein
MERLIKAAFSKEAAPHVNEAHHFSDAVEFKLLRHIHTRIAAYRVINVDLRYNRAIKLFSNGSNGAAAVRMRSTKT